MGVLSGVIGNGRALGQVSFEGSVPIYLLAVLAVAKAVVTLMTIGSGASGGTLTPSLAIGAALGAVGGGLWSAMWPGTPLAAFALVAAAAFLASTMRAPITALVLAVEFSAAPVGMFLPLLLAVTGSTVVARLLERRRIQGID